MTTRCSRNVLIAVLMTFSLAAAACSSGGGGNPNTAADNSSNDADIPDGFGDGPGSGDVGFFGSEECRQLAEAFGGFSGGTDGDNFDQTADFLREAADNAPDEVADDLRVMADTYDELLDNPANIGAAFSSGDFLEATTNLSVFIAENCAGIDIEG